MKNNHTEPRRIVKERPILFSAPMVKALLAGTKTQTRRIVKPQPCAGGGMRMLARSVGIAARTHQLDGPHGLPSETDVFCPYGQPGDRLWVRETWAPNFRAPLGASDKSPYVLYRANGDGETRTKWKPSIFMRRHSSRIILEITSVRVEWLKSISDDDAKAEGVTVRLDAVMAAAHAGPPETPARMEYWHLWETINGRGSWEANPWVWVISFQRITP